MKKGETNLDNMVKAIRAENADTCIVLEIMNDNWDSPKGTGSASHRPKLE